MSLRNLLPTLTATPLQITTYLLGVALFSISFLVFLNSSVSFVITDLIGRHHGVGDAVGSLGFADELVALVACPVWGIVSDRVGVRTVCVIGYTIIGLSLFVFVQAKNVYPQLLLARLFFSLGGAATSTMVTAILPTMTEDTPAEAVPETRTETIQGNGHAATPSVSSEVTITPARYRSPSPRPEHSSQTRQHKSPQVKESPLHTSAASTSQLAGLVGMFTGLGALIALGIFLPLPARFQKAGVSPPAAVADSFYVVGSIAFIIAVFCFLGLRKLPGEDKKGFRALLGREPSRSSSEPLTSNFKAKTTSYKNLILSSLSLGFKDQNISLAYLGGFVARASSVGISLFIPLFVNAYFISSGLCPDNRNDGNTNEDIKRNCRRAYSLAAALTGVSQLVALLLAPVFGYLSGRYSGRWNIPLLVAALAGVVGYVAFGLVKNPDPSSEGGSGVVFLVVALLGISQIGAIVCSLGLLGRGIQGSDEDADRGTKSESRGRENQQSAAPNAGYPSVAAHTHPNPNQSNTNSNPSSTFHSETTPLLPTISQPSFAPSLPSQSRTHLKGTLAGLYSLSGGAGILLLTKLGGYMFDAVSPGSPFFLLAGFNLVLLLVGAGVGVGGSLRGSVRGRRRGGDGDGEG